MGFLTKRLSFDLGTSKIRIIKDGKLVLSESSRVCLDGFKAISFGDDVKPNGDCEILEPLRAGVIADFNAFEQLLRYLTHKALDSNALIKPTLKVLVTIPDFITEVEIRAIRDSMEHAGAREVFMIYTTHATVKGLGLDIKDTFLIVDAGAGKVSSSVFSDNMMYCPSRVDFGANKFKKVIDFYITKYYNISCTDLTKGIVHWRIGD
jgi:rod shape-determining protein MreB